MVLPGRLAGDPVLAFLLVASAVAAPLARPEKSPVPTVITSVGVVGRDGAVSAPRDVWLDGGAIAAVTDPGAPGPFTPERRVDGTGATLMPGLADLHVHLTSTTAVPGRLHVPSPRKNLDALLFAGVTDVLDLAADPEDVARWSRRVDAGAWAGPEIVGAGRPFGAPGGHPRASLLAMYPSFLVKLTTTWMAWEVSTAEGVDDALAEQGPTPFVKVVLDSFPPGAPVISDEALARLRERATDAGERLVAHTGRAEDVERALALPVDALVHAPHTGEIRPELAQGLAAAEIPVVATLAVWQAFQQVEVADPWRGPLEQAIAPGPVRRDLDRAAAGKAPVEGAVAPWSHALPAGEPTRLGNVTALHEAGVRVLVGSDSPGLGLVAGAATHREMAMLVQAGMTPSEVLAAATWGNHRFLDPGALTGAVEAGYEADLLLVRGDPSADIAATTDIAAVWADGRLVDRRPRR